MRPKVGSPAAALLVLAALAAACGSTPNRPRLGDPVVITRAPPDDVELDPAERDRIEERIDAIEAMLARHEYEQALEAIDTELERELPVDLRNRLGALRVDARKNIYDRPVVRGVLRADRDLYAFGEEIRFRVILESLSDHRVTIPIRERGTSEGYLFLRIVRERIDVYGNVRTDSEQGRVALPGDIAIPPASVWDAGRTLPTGNRAHDGFSVFRIEGYVRPAVLRDGPYESYRRIDLEPAVVHVMPRNYEPLADDPVGSLRVALEKRAPVHLLVAAELVPSARREECAGRLVDALRHGAGRFTPAIVSSLRRLTGESLPIDADAWIAWWEERHGER